MLQREAGTLELNLQLDLARASRAFELALRNYWQRGSSSTRLSPMQA